MAEANALTAKLQLGAIHQDHVMLRTAAELTLEVTPIPIISKTSTVIISVWTIHMAKKTKVCVSCQKTFKCISKMYLKKKTFRCFRLPLAVFIYLHTRFCPQ